MKIQIFILNGDDDKVIIDRTYLIREKSVPTEINLQEIVDNAYEYLDQELKDEANRLTQHND